MECLGHFPGDLGCDPARLSDIALQRDVFPPGGRGLLFGDRLGVYRHRLETGGDPAGVHRCLGGNRCRARRSGGSKHPPCAAPDTFPRECVILQVHVPKSEEVKSKVHKLELK